MAAMLKFGASLILPPETYNTLFNRDAQYQQLYNGTGDEPNSQRTDALEEVKRKDGSVALDIGTRETGKCVSVDTPICLSNGNVIRAGDCRPGQTILAMKDNLKISSTLVLATANLGRHKCL